MPPTPNEVEKKGIIVAVVLVHKLILLIKVVFWRMIFILVEKPRYVRPTTSLDICINIRIRVTLLILSVKTTLNVKTITVVRRAISLLTTAYIN
jgi:hypothetical protein